MSKLTALIDGDVIAFRCAAVVQHTRHWPSGLVDHFARQEDGEAALENMLYGLKEKLGYTDFKVFLSCPAMDNWRLKVDPTYKSNRADSVRPLLLGYLKGYLRNKYAAQHMTYLEADDAIGIYMTDPSLVDGERIAVGKDKDFLTIPGRHFQIGDEKERYVEPLEARLFHYCQTLSGDAVDGYAGCPGIGPKRAREIVENPVMLLPREGVVTRGPRKGEKVTRWVKGEPCSVWEAIVSNYEKAGLKEADAIKTARLARILQAGDYDLETKQITLWVPGKE